MKLVIILAILIVIAIWTVVITQLAIAKSKDNDNKKSTSDQTTTNGDKQLSKDSDIIPIEPTVSTNIVPISEGKTTTVTTCTDEPNDKECAAKKIISNTPDPTIQKVTQ
jgi:hypothetical protein